MKLHVESEAGLPHAAREILKRREGRTVIALYGLMGAGKTTLVREIAAALGSADTVTSPTFALVNRYADGRGEEFFHFDFYRIERQEEAFDLGYEEYFYSGSLCLVEWPEKIESLLPDDAMRVRINIISPQSREISIE